jgi:hypothetical protein
MAKKPSKPAQTNAGSNPMGKPAAPRVSAGVRAAGPVVSVKEATKIAEGTGKTVAQVMAKAVNAGAALGSGLVNQFNAGKLGINRYSPYGGGNSPSANAALKDLQALQGLQMNKGTAYAGYSTTYNPAVDTSTVSGGGVQRPATTTYNPIVLPRNVVSGGRPAAPATAAPAAPAAGGEVANWENSVENSNQALIDSINAQIEANASQAQLYMGQIDSLMQAMQQQSMNPAGGLQSFTPYAVTTNVAPATGAQTTQAITARKKPAVTDLTLNPLVMADAGTGLNIGI